MISDDLSDGDRIQPLSDDTALALVDLQERLVRTVNLALIERYERAADELLRHPGRRGDPVRIATRASANARKVVRDHLRLQIPYDEALDSRTCADREQRLAFELHDFLDRSHLSPRDTLVLRCLLDGLEAEDIACKLNVGLKRAQVYVSRARRAARTAWLRQ